MADLHHQHGTTVVEERDGAGTALMVLIAVAVIGFLIWLFAFSGVFGGDDDVDVNVRDGDRTENVLPGGNTDGGTTDGGSTDGGTTDGTTDGGTTDGGTTDGGTTQDSP